jgi:lipopolysaccharide/colanic/teichoic acid biosynthesis glycosyltransferase
MYKNNLKRFLDLLISFLMIIILFPMLFFLTLLLTYFNKGNPFFIQKRPGLNEIIFSLVKFKSMNDLKDINGNLLPDSVRLTSVGRFLRKTSLDEIPQLFNVIKGDMSFVGPRPLRIRYLERYNDEQRKRHNVLPGITGWAQINGRNAISWENKFEYDLWYVNNQSFFLDLKILFLTIKKVFKSEGISQLGQETTEEFKGNN